jgi:Transposase IS116/IS110/IS902 family
MPPSGRDADENGREWQRGEQGEVGRTSGATSPKRKLTLVRPAELTVASCRRVRVGTLFVVYAPPAHDTTSMTATPTDSAPAVTRYRKTLVQERAPAVPRLHKQSGGKRLSGKTTNGNPYLRAVRTEVAWVVSRMKDNYLAAQYHRLARPLGRWRTVCW